MREIDGMRRRLEATDGIAPVLAASWDAFSLIAEACHACERGSRELFAAFAFAATAAAEGRTIVAGAPSLPAGHGAAASPGELVSHDITAVADALADLAGALHSRLASASVRARDAGDRAACADGAVQAALVRELLARGGS